MIKSMVENEITATPSALKKLSFIIQRLLP